jgi:hypothetical protein
MRMVFNCNDFFEFNLFFQKCSWLAQNHWERLALANHKFLVWRIMLAQGVSGYEGYQSKTFNTLNQGASTKEQHNHNTQFKGTPLPISHCKKVL